MLKYITKRILLFIPTLVAITLLGFILISSAPGDPLDVIIPTNENSPEMKDNPAVREKRLRLKEELGLNLPYFYVSMSSLAAPDSIGFVEEKTHRTAILRLSKATGNPDRIWLYYKAIGKFRTLCNQIVPDSNFTHEHYNQLVEAKALGYGLPNLYIQADIIIQLEAIHDKIQTLPVQNGTIAQLMEIRQLLENSFQHTSRWKCYVPVIRFHLLNQYHRWLFGDGNMLTGKGSKFSRGIIRGDFGKSYISQVPVSKGLGGKLWWSVILTLTSVMMGYLVSIPLGVIAAKRKDSLFDRISSVALYILYSLPNFFVATLLLMFFSNPDNLNWFPSSGIKPVEGYPEGSNLLERMYISIPFMVMPVIAYTYSTLAFLSRTMRVSMLEILSQDYIRTARAKGLKESSVTWKHALKNSLLPIITIFANIFPAAVGGSVILESIFTIPGMGLETVSAIYARNYPVIIAVFTLTGILTMIGYLISDILYAWIDPRISFNTKQ